jgi:hypothetical protein
MPVVGFLRSETLTNVPPERVTAFRQGLKEAGFIEGQSVAIEIHSSEDQTLSRSSYGIPFGSGNATTPAVRIVSGLLRVGTA